jgi:hypothetical protein
MDQFHSDRAVLVFRVDAPGSRALASSVEKNRKTLR